jgi:protoheme IX farnesyltransferase
MSVSAETMSPATTPAAPAVAADAPPRRLAAALVELTKPRIVVMVLMTVAVGYCVAPAPRGGLLNLLITLAGTGLVAAGSSAFNQLLERSRDARMRRTARRPLPTGRVSPRQAALFGATLGCLGVAVLALGEHPLAATVAGATFGLYVLVYTPMKPRTTLNTAIGAIPGALPPVIGWAAATGDLAPGAWTLFLILFLWQFPHFLSIAWVYREDYARGGLRMLPIVDPTGAITGRQSTLYALALLPAGLLPAALGMAGPLYFAGALALGLYYLAASARFWADVSDASARRLMRASFLYLPLILLLLVLDPTAR